MKRKKICFIVAVPITAHAFLRKHIEALSKNFDVYLVGNIKNADDIKNLSIEGWYNVDIRRGISLWHDLKAVFNTRRYFKQMKFDAIHSVTPKAGLISAIAGKWARMRERSHIFTGQVWATKRGIMRRLLKTFDKVIIKLDNHIFVDGKSQREFLIQEGLLTKNQAIVFENGSISGVDSSRFSFDKDQRILLRNEIGIKKEQFTFIFLGRLKRDKGIIELFEAFNRLAAEEDDIFLLLVGFDEEQLISKLPNYNNIKENVNFHYYGTTSHPEIILNAGDVFVLPTYREGFGTSVLEAASVGLPCICSDTYGVLDAYVENETGLRCHVGDAKSLYECMKKMYDNPKLVKQMGINSRKRVLKDFKGETITECWVNFYKTILSKVDE